MRRMFLLLFGSVLMLLHAQSEPAINSRAFQRYSLIPQNFSAIPADQIAVQKHSFLNLAGQAVLGQVLAVGFAAIPAYLTIASAFIEEDNGAVDARIGIAALFGLTIFAYSVGAATGVHWIAKAENPNHSFWGTVGYAAIGVGASSVLYAVLMTQQQKISGVGAVAIMIFPIISAMLYTSYIANWPSVPQSVSVHNKILCHRDLVGRSKLCNIELLRITL